MQEKIIIYLHIEDLEHPSWGIVDKANRVRESAYKDDANALAQIAEDKEIIVIVPAEDVVLTLAKLPKMNRSRLQHALPFALEEQLIEDVHALHFAFEGYFAEGEVPVSIVSHEKMQVWINLLQAWHIAADKLIPASLTLPVEDKAWYVSLSETAIVRIGHSMGFGCDKNNLQDLLKLALASADIKPEKICIQNYTQDKIRLDLPITIVEEHVEAKRSVTDCANHLDNNLVINLLQGPYKPKKSRLPRKAKLFKAFAYFGIVWMLVVFSYPIISYFILKQRVNEINAGILQIYKRNFPQANSIVAPKLRIEEKLRKLTNHGNENRFLILLGYVTKALNASTNIKIKRLDFQNNQLTFELIAASSEDFSAFIDFLQKQKLKVKQQNANLKDSQINATLILE